MMMPQADTDASTDSFDVETSSPEWMSVRYARRAVTVAWVSAAVNLLVVAVALWTPLVQSRMERDNKEQAEYRRKVALIEHAKHVYAEAMHNSGSLGLVMDPDYDFGAPMDIKTRTEIIDQMLISIDNALDENRFLFNQINDDINYGSFVSAIHRRINHIKFAAQRTKYIINNKGLAGIPTLKSGQKILERQYKLDIGQIKLLIHLNVDENTLAAKREPVVYADCDNAVYKNICDEAYLVKF